jgi:hypothetical protein
MLCPVEQLPLFCIDLQHGHSSNVVSNHPLTVYLINYATATATLHPVQQLPLCCINLQFSHSSTVLSNHLYLISYAAATVIRPATWSRSRCPLEVMRLPLSMDQFTKSVFNILRYESRTTTLLIKTRVSFSKHQL